jgi:hypothetical protein
MLTTIRRPACCLSCGRHHQHHARQRRQPLDLLFRLEHLSILRTRSENAAWWPKAKSLKKHRLIDHARVSGQTRV